MWQQVVYLWYHYNRAEVIKSDRTEIPRHSYLTQQWRTPRTTRLVRTIRQEVAAYTEATGRFIQKISDRRLPQLWSTIRIFFLKVHLSYQREKTPTKATSDTRYTVDTTSAIEAVDWGLVYITSQHKICISRSLQIPCTSSAGVCFSSMGHPH